MNRTLTTLALTAVLGISLAGTAVGTADAREGEAGRYQVGSCDDGILVADVFVVESGRRDTNRVHLTGTITRTGDHLSGRYSEAQADRYRSDGQESYTGLLSHLVVPGRGSFSVAGRAVVHADGDFTFTPGVRPLAEGEWESDVCAALD